MQSFFPIISSISLLLAASCSHEPKHPAVTQKFEPVSALIEGDNQFTVSFYKEASQKPGNLFVSPYNISSAFGMAALGARGKTAEQMYQTLHQTPSTLASSSELQKKLESPKQPKKEDTLLQFANSIWIQKDFSILPAFKKSMTQDFGTSFESVDFAHHASQAVKTINQWVDLHTKNKIKELVSEDDISQETRLVITSAVYMKAEWMYPFDKNATTKEPFYSTSKESIDVDTMHNTEAFNLYVNDDIALVELPYNHESEQGSHLSMFIALPKDRGGLDKLEHQLTLSQLSDWIHSSKKHRVWLSLPKFKIETALELNDFMINLGMSDAFIPTGDFSGITGNKDLYISKAVHKTFINVDEQGTEAAAATGVMMSLTSILEPEEPYRMQADHPFLFVIMDRKTDTILFIGRVVKP